MVRLQRVTFLALHNYLGLTTELFNPVSAFGAFAAGPQPRESERHRQCAFYPKAVASGHARARSPGPSPESLSTR